MVDVKTVTRGKQKGKKEGAENTGRRTGGEKNVVA